jgi:hypothetical protein
METGPPSVFILREAFAGGHAMLPIEVNTLNVSRAFWGAPSFSSFLL